MKKSDFCVVFDLDDTLYLERDFVRSGFRAVGKWCAEKLRLTGVGELAQALFDEGRRGDIFDAALEHLHSTWNAETVEAMVRVYREHVPEIELPEDAVQCLRQLQGRVHLCLLTDGNPISQVNKLDSLGIRSLFESVVVTGKWGSEFFKPHPRGFRSLEAEFASLQPHFLYVADNPSKDFFAPRELGWNAIRVRRSAGLHEYKRCPARLVRCELPDLTRIPDLIREIS
ncbi:MAG: HAD family hydrolase [Acidobacteria bacterium]|nr:MAG: HAD family hydrolase [Acidobacteriota bacterium]